MRTFMLALALSALIAAPAVACGPSGGGGPGIPPLAIGIDHLLPQSSLPEPQMQQIRTLREDIRKLVAANREDEARAVEEKAMQLLGYKKMWLACGPGTFMWVKFEPA